jgi:hypothetical protein
MPFHHTHCKDLRYVGILIKEALSILSGIFENGLVIQAPF